MRPPCTHASDLTQQAALDEKKRRDADAQKEQEDRHVSDRGIVWIGLCVDPMYCVAMVCASLCFRVS